MKLTQLLETLTDASAWPCTSSSWRLSTTLNTSSSNAGTHPLVGKGEAEYKELVGEHCADGHGPDMNVFNMVEDPSSSS